jgi:hypothetical protein
MIPAQRIMPDGRILNDRHGVGGHVKDLAFATGKGILNDPMVKKEGKKMMRKAGLAGLKLIAEAFKK